MIGAALAALTALCWAQMVGMSGEAAGPQRFMPCCGAHFGTTLSMWVVMMAGMMIPSAAPMVLTHAAIARRSGAVRPPWVATALFLAGYLVAWSCFAALAAIAQWALFRWLLLDPRTLSISPWAGGVLLIAAGVFQLSPTKARCLTHCRAPLGYFMTEWREGFSGALHMGLRHGVLCTGCCWLLMAVLFGVGIMNVLWGAALTLFVLAEKILPWRRAIVWLGAAGCVAGGFGLMARAALGP
ncbi:MAG: DUF2182 domain-containing protein [Polyangiales bacterium]